jgi:hypothetical protein
VLVSLAVTAGLMALPAGAAAPPLTCGSDGTAHVSTDVVLRGDFACATIDIDAPVTIRLAGHTLTGEVANTSGLTIVGGTVAGDIEGAGDLSVARATVTGEVGTSSGGARLAVTHSTIGVEVFSDGGRLVVTSSTMPRLFVADLDGPASLSIRDSTISHGGGIFIEQVGPGVRGVVRGSTISDNTLGGPVGGGILVGVTNTASLVTLIDDTIVDNQGWGVFEPIVGTVVGHGNTLTGNELGPICIGFDACFP